MLESDWLDVAELYRVYWPDRPLPAEQITAWFPLVADLGRGDVIAALKAVKIGGKPFAPDISEIRATVVGPPRRWEDALAELGDAVGRVGAYGQRPVFADAALERVVAERGWRALCMAVYGDATWRAQFRDAYTAAQRAKHTQEVRHMVGLPTGVPRTALPAVTRRPAEEPPEDAPPLTLAQAFSRMRTVLTDADDGIEAPPDAPPNEPTTAAERRVRARAARRRVARAQEAWSREAGKALASPEHRARVERTVAAVLRGHPQPGPVATLDPPPAPAQQLPDLPPPPDEPPEEETA
jgi:hypothetical protein